MSKAAPPQYDYFEMYENYRDRQHSITLLSSAIVPPELPLVEEFPTPDASHADPTSDYEEDPGSSEDEEYAAPPPSPRKCGHETFDHDCASCLVRWHLAAYLDDLDEIHSYDEYGFVSHQNVDGDGETLGRHNGTYYGPRGSLDLHTITSARIGEKKKKKKKTRKISNWTTRKLGRMGVLRLARRIKWAVRTFVDELREIEEIGQGEQWMDLSYRV